MSGNAVATERLDSWKEIAAYIGRTVRTAIRWEKDRGLPVHRIPGGERHAVFAWRHEIDVWLASGPPPDANESIPAAVTDEGFLPADGLQASLVDAVLPKAVSAVTRETARAYGRRIPRWPVAIGLLAVLALAAGLRSVIPKRVIYGGSLRPIASDGAIKDYLITDGRSLYFDEWREGKIGIYSTPISGGIPKEILTPFVQSMALDVSRDSRQLLVLQGEGTETERALWSLPIGAHGLNRIGQVTCHSAVWSPDNLRIAFAHENSIYITDSNGHSPQLLHTFTAVPEELHWSLDGRRLIFTLRDMAKWRSAVWKLELDDMAPGLLDSLVPLSFGEHDFTTVSGVMDSSDDLLANDDNSIFLIEPAHRPWRFRTQQLRSSPSLMISVV